VATMIVRIVKTDHFWAKVMPSMEPGALRVQLNANSRMAYFEIDRDEANEFQAAIDQGFEELPVEQNIDEQGDEAPK